MSSTNGTIAEKSKKSWLVKTDHEYKQMIDKWLYTAEVYLNTYADKGKAKQFLNKRYDKETRDTMKLRIDKAVAAMDLAIIVTKIVGQVFSAAKDDKREWGEFGDPKNEKTVAGQIFRDCDGKGTNYPVFWRQFATELLVYLQSYILIEGEEKKEVFGEDGKLERVEISEPRFVIITPDMVHSKGEKKGRLIWIKVRHEMIPEEVSGNPRADQEPQIFYTLYTLDGWVRYRYHENDDVEVEVDRGPYEFYTTTQREVRRLPIVRAKFPFKYYITHYLAKIVIRIFNHESALDAFLSESTMIHYIEESSPWEFQEHQEDRNAGETEHNMTPGSKAYYLAPPEGPARLLSEEIDKQRKMLHEMAFQAFGDAAKESTATEIIFDKMSGVLVFLILYVTSLDEAENQAMFIREQIEYPNDSSRWGKFKVERSTKFLPFNPEKIVELMERMTFGGEPLPFTDTMIEKVVLHIWENHFGFEAPKEELTKLKEQIQVFIEKRDGTSRAAAVEDFLKTELDNDGNEPPDDGAGKEQNPKKVANPPVPAEA